MTPQQAADSVVFELEDKLMSRFGRAGDLRGVHEQQRRIWRRDQHQNLRSWWRRLASPSPFSVPNACGRKRTITR